MINSPQHIPQSSIEIYTAPDNSIQLQVKLDQETVWLTANQMAMLFGRDVKTIRKHINNALREELAGEVVGAKFASTTHHGAMEDKTQTNEVMFYNLEMVTSVGFRVKSQRGVQFRKWANKILKEYLLKGYAVRTNMQLKQYEELKQLVGVLQQTIQNEALTTNEARDLVKVVTDYTYALDTLDNYDYQRLAISDTEGTERFHATYENAMEAIRSLKEKFGESWLFGNEKDDSFKSSIGQIYQTFGGESRDVAVFGNKEPLFL